MTPTTLFKVFCLESYKSAHNLTGAKAAECFKRYGVFEYIDSFYDILHSTGDQYIVEDIDQFIDSRKSTSPSAND